MLKKRFPSNAFPPELGTAEHDRLLLWLQKNWKKAVLRTPYVGGGDRSAVQGELILAPILEGKPPLYPDAIAHAKVGYDHTEIPRTVVFETVDRRIEAWVKCTAPDCDAKLFFLGDATPAKATEQWRRERLEEVNRGPLLCYGLDHVFLFEVRPQIESVGVTLRELQLYRQNLQTAKENENATRMIFLVTNDNRWEDEFFEQNVFVIKPTDASGGAPEPVKVPVRTA